MPGAGRRERALLGATAAVLGTLAWCWFFDWGRDPLASFDWRKELAYLAVFRDAIRGGVLPLHTSVAFQDTHRFLANPEVPLSPQLLLLAFLGPRTYAVVNWCALQVVGVAGIVALSGRLGLRAAATALLLLVLSWNGHLVAHVAVGHSMWAGYAFYPWFAWALFGALEASESRRPRWARRMAIALTLAMAQGAFHLVAWLLGTLVLVGVGTPRMRRTVGRTLAWFGGLAAFRWVPAVVAFADVRRAANPGFPDAATLLEALVVVRDYRADRIANIGWWEFDTFVGVTALALMLGFGVSAWWTGHRTSRALLLPVVFFTVASLGELWMPIADLPLPLVNAERGPSRFLLVPVFFLTIVAAQHADAWLAARPVALRPLVQVVSAVALLAVAAELGAHLEAWRMPHTAARYAPLDVDLLAVPDTRYVVSLVIGAAATLVTVLLAWRAACATRRTERALAAHAVVDAPAEARTEASADRAGV